MCGYAGLTDLRIYPDLRSSRLHFETGANTKRSIRPICGENRALSIMCKQRSQRPCRAIFFKAIAAASLWLSNELRDIF